MLFSSERTLGFPELDRGSAPGGDRENTANSHCFAAGGQRRRQKKKSGAQPEANRAACRSYLSLAGISFPVAGTKWLYLKLAVPRTPDASQCGTGAPAYAVIDGIVYPDRIDAPAHDGQQPVQPHQDVYLAGGNRLPAEFVATGGGGRLSLDREPLFP
jgi:hypothetical protein